MRIIALCLLMVLLCTFVGDLTAQNQSTKKSLRIGTVVDGPWERNKEFRDALLAELTETLGSQAQVIMQPDKSLEGDWTLEGIKKINDRLLEDSEVDLVLGMGVIASQDLSTRGPLPKPAIAPIVLDPQRQRIPFKAGTSGVKNLNYLIFPTTLERDLKLFQEIVPFKKVAYVSSKRYINALPPIDFSWEDLGKQLGVEFTRIYVDDSADEVLQAIPQDAEAVYYEPVLHLPPVEFGKLVRGFIVRRLPSFSLLGESEARRGIMAGANPDFFPRLARRIALNIQRILDGQDPGTIAVAFPAGKRLFINLKTATAVGVSPSWSTLLEAELIDIDSTSVAGVQRFTLETAARRIVTSNLDLQAKMHEVSAEAENVSIARSNLLPRIDLGSTGLQIDQDRAEAAYQPERTASGEVSVSQLLFSEPALANLSIQSSLRDSRQSDYEVTRLNMVSEGAFTYLNYLRARKVFYILLDNLHITRSNLELAQIRQSIGSAGPDEPLRWEVEIAELRRAAIDVQAGMNQALLSLKQFLNVPLIYTLNIADVSMEDPAMFLSNQELVKHLENPVSFDILTDFAVQEGIALSQEIKQLDAVISAQQRNLRSTRLTYALPTVAAFAKYSNNFYKSSEPRPFQTGTPPIPPEGLDPKVPFYLGQLLSSVSPQLPDRNDWSAGIQLSFNLFNGFATRAAEQKASLQLDQYQTQRNAVAQKIELRIRAAMEEVKAKYFAIQQTRLEQEAAQKTMGIVTDAYSRGAVSILNLLDAQNVSLRADQVAANAVYDFFVAYMQFQRAVGRFDLLMAAGEREEFMQRLMRFMANALKR
jgi:outer membrane protein